MSQTRYRLSKLAGKPRMARLTRDYAGEPYHNGFVLGLGQGLVLFHQLHDFYPEGYTALRVDDIKKVRSSDNERFWEEMLRGEGLLERMGISYQVPLDDFPSLLAFLHRRRQYVIIECENRTNAENDTYLIGRIVSLDEEFVTTVYFDSIGRWEDQPTVIPYGSITRIQFDTPYLNTITRYLKKPPPGYGLDLGNGHQRPAS